MKIKDNLSNKDLIKFNLGDVEKYVRGDELQSKKIEDLAKLRGANVETYYKAGIFYVGEEIDDIYEIMEDNNCIDESVYEDLDKIEAGEDVEYPEIGERWGIREKNENYFLNSYIIPITDTYGDLIKFVSYSNKRGSDLKYINIDLLDKEDEILYPNIKIYGMRNTKEAFNIGKIFILEGMFDTLRMEEEGLPATNLMGSKLTEYQRDYYSRFKKLVYIRDEDKTGEQAFNKFKEVFPHAMQVTIPVSNIKDVDDYGKAYKEDGALRYKEWMDELRNI